MYTLTSSIILGSSYTGLILKAQLLNIDGTNNGSEINSSFIEVGSGCYLWTYNSFPSNFRGGVKIYESGSPSTVLTLLAINPQEAEIVEDINQNILNNSVNVKIGYENRNVNVNAGVR